MPDTTPVILAIYGVGIATIFAIIIKTAYKKAKAKKAKEQAESKGT